jgi:hypothetical protein
MPSSIDRGNSNTPSWIVSALLATASLALWFWLAFPWQQHNE